MNHLLKKVTNVKLNDLSMIYLIWGTETILFDEIVSGLTNSVNPIKEDDMNITHFDLNDTSIDDVIFEAQTYPFFGEKKLIFVHSSFIFTGKRVTSSINHSFESLEDYMNNPSDFSSLVFLAPYDKLDKRKKITKQLLKTAEVIEVNPGSDKDTLSYIKDKLISRGFEMSGDSLERLLQLTDRNLTKATRELDKLMIYHNEDKIITLDSVNSLVSKSLEQNIFELNEKVLNKNVRQSIELYHDLLNQKEDPIKILALMMAQFRLLLQVKILRTKGYQQADIAGILKVHPYRVKLALQTEKRFKQTVLSSAHHKLIDADYAIKTGKINPEIQIELFIWKFSTME